MLFRTARVVMFALLTPLMELIAELTETNAFSLSHFGQFYLFS